MTGQVGQSTFFQLNSPFGERDPFHSPFLGNHFSIHSKVDEWEEELKDDKDREFLLEGIRKGFRITNAESKIVEAHGKNHKSALKHDMKGCVEKELKKQIAEGHYIKAKTKPAIISPLAAIPKDDGSVRIIHDASVPEGSSLNDYTEHHSVRYKTIQDACKLAKRGYFCAKVDLQGAYRSVGVHPDDYKATGVAWKFQGDEEETYLFDSRLCFGSKCGPSHFTRISNAITRIAHKHGYENILSYIDDFLLVFESKEKCNEALQFLLALLRRLGFNISWKKVVCPTQHVTFLGVDIDTRNCELSLGAKKLSELHDKLLAFKNRARASKKQLQSLAGSLNWACQVLRGGRFFLRRILDNIRHAVKPRHKIRLTKDFKADLSWWLCFLYDFNGRVYYRDLSDVHVHVDACKKACGMFWAGRWHYSVFKYDWPLIDAMHINYKEVCAVIESVRQWASEWAGRTVVIHTDSSVAKAIVNKGRSKHPYINALLRSMCWLSLKHGFEIRAIHIPGLLHSIPDSISRLTEKGQLEKLCTLLSRWHHNRSPSPLSGGSMSFKSWVCLYLQQLRWRRN